MLKKKSRVADSSSSIFHKKDFKTSVTVLSLKKPIFGEIIILYLMPNDKQKEIQM